MFWITSHVSQIVTFAIPIGLLLGMHITSQKTVIIVEREICQDMLVDKTYNVLHFNNIQIYNNLYIKYITPIL